MTHADEPSLRLELFRELVDHAPVGLGFVSPAGELVYANDRWRLLAGYAGELPAGTDVMLGLVHHDDRHLVVATFRRSAEGQEEIRERVRVNLPDDQLRHLTLAVRTMRRDGDRISGYAIGLGDVTELMSALEEVRRSEVRFRSVTENLPIGVFRVDPSERIIWANSRMAELAADTLEESVGRSVFSWVHPDDLERVYVESLDALQRRVPLESMHRFVAADGTVRWTIARSTPIFDESGQLVEHVGSLEDVTELHLRSEHLAHQAAHDPLTGIPNRASLVAVLAELCERQPRRRDIGLVFVDLDGFKAVNDTHGHRAGDAALVEVGARIGGAIRAEDVVGRYGGDEFLVVCPRVDDSGVLERVAERVAAAICDVPITDGDRTYPIGASIGTAIGPGDRSPEEFIAAADAAMYAAKRSRTT